MTPEVQTGEPWTILARLVRPQGRHGEILADLLTDFPERFADRRELFLLSSEASPAPSRQVALENHWLHKGRIVLKFAGIESINDANMLRGMLVAIPANERAALADGSVYLSDLIGCRILDLNRPDGKPADVGVVTDVDRDAGLLAVNTPQDDEVLIPFAADYLVRIDPVAKRIEMRLPVGLLEINDPMSEEERQEMNTSTSDE